MKRKTEIVEQELQNSDYRIRKLIGILGLLLPFLLLLVQGELLSSISHYYYQAISSIIFIIILSTFGLFLISYKGYKIDRTTETLSDDFITNLGGFMALIVVFIPTRCDGSGSEAIDLMCSNGNLPLLGHDMTLKGTIHLVCAGIFIFTMGWMSRFKFTRSPTDPNINLYKVCGNIVFISIALLIVLLILEKLGVSFWMDHYYVFILETVAILSFGISWLVKGKFIENMKTIRARITKP